MQIGAMNHPARDPVKEIAWMAEMKLDFIDLTIEPPAAAAWKIRPAEIRAALDHHQMGVVGHTAYYLPMASPFESIRCAARDEFKHCLDLFASIGAKLMNLHPDRHAPMHPRSFTIGQNIKTIQELLPFARERGITLMIENLPGDFNNAQQLSEILDPLPELALHLDIGHSNLMTEYNTAEEVIARYGGRLRHVHLHDNKGGTADLHLPLGAGSLDVPKHVRILKRSGYDASITLEVFSPDTAFLAHSRDRLRALWDSAP